MEILNSGTKDNEKDFSESIINLQNRKILTITGVEKVFESNENKIQLKVSGSNLLIVGENLSVSRLDVAEGKIEISGLISDLKFATANNGKSFLKKIFK